MYLSPRFRLQLRHYNIREDATNGWVGYARLRQIRYVENRRRYDESQICVYQYVHSFPTSYGNMRLHYGYTAYITFFPPEKEES